MKVKTKRTLVATMSNILRTEKYGSHNASDAMSLAWKYANEIEERHIPVQIAKFYSDSAGRIVTKVIEVVPGSKPGLQNYIDVLMEILGQRSFRRFKISNLRSLSKAA